MVWANENMRQDLYKFHSVFFPGEKHVFGKIKPPPRQRFSIPDTLEYGPAICYDKDTGKKRQIRPRTVALFQTTLIDKYLLSLYNAPKINDMVLASENTCPGSRQRTFLLGPCNTVAPVV